MKKENYGFVYIWFDTKLKRFYIGSHWNSKKNPETDGYICSSNGMRENYRYRPNTFKRRIISRVYTNRNDLLEEEEKWLNKIPKEEFGKKYYNKNASAHFYSWWANEDTKRIVGQKISNHPTRGKKISETQRGKIVSEETKEKLRHAGKQQWNNLSEEDKQAHADRCRTNIAGWSKGLIKETHPQLAHTAESKEKIRQAGIGRKFGEEFRNKIKIRMLTNNHMKGEKHRPETLKKMSCSHLKRWKVMTEEEKLSRNKKISIARTGMKFTEDHCKNISLSRIGKYTGKDNPFYGKQHSKDSIEKMLYTRSLRLDNKSTLKGDNRTEAQRAADIGQRGKPKPKRKVSCSICFRLINSSNIGRHETFCMKQHNLSI